jgi:hypothetical protein
MRLGDTYKTKALDNAGKPLTGAALTNFLKKRTQGACEPKAVSQDGKSLLRHSSQT